MPASGVMNQQAAVLPVADQSPTSIREYAVWPPTAGGDECVSDVRVRLHGERRGTVSHIAILSGTRLVGLVRSTDLMAAGEQEKLGDLTMAAPPIVDADDTPERAAWIVSELGESEAAVTGADGQLVGVVPASAIISLMVHEHAEDLARLGGFLHRSSAAQRASNESVLWRLWHRLPWLLVGLVGAVIASVIVSGYEEQLSAVVSLSFFVPAIVYLANAVGAQTQSIAVRGLTVGVGIRSVLFRELVTGVVLGAILGGVFIVPAYFLAGDWHVAVAVGVALLAACGLANLTALGMPWVLTLFKSDPAFGSGPVATVVQDLSSIIVYFAIATVIVPGI